MLTIVKMIPAKTEAPVSTFWEASDVNVPMIGQAELVKSVSVGFGYFGVFYNS